MAVMSTSLRWLVALGPRLVALLVLVAALVLAPAPLPAEPEPCCCPRPAECTCLDRDPSAPASLRRCSQPVDAAAPVTAAPAALPPPVTLRIPAAATPAPVTALPAPHASPEPERARGPS